MATFTDIYKQELKSKGILSSISSAAGKRLREKTDIRNILFGGKGIFSATGQKIFGKGYSALDKTKAPLTSTTPDRSASALSANIERIVKNTAPLSGIRSDIGYIRKDTAQILKIMSKKDGDGKSDSAFSILSELKGLGATLLPSLTTLKTIAITAAGIAGVSVGAKKLREMNAEELKKPENYNVPSNRAEREGITKGQAGARNAAEARTQSARTKTQANDVVKAMADQKLSGAAAEDFLRQYFPTNTPTLAQILEECDANIKDLYTKKIAETKTKPITPAPSAAPTAPSPATQDWRAAERASYGETAPTQVPSNAVTTSTGTPVTTGTGGFVTSGEPKTPTAPTPAPAAVPSTAPSKMSPRDLVISELEKAGFSKTAQANILAQVQAESGFRPRSEEIEKYSANTLFKLYPKRFASKEEAQNLVNMGPEAVAEKIYGGRMGNNQPGDGWKYRGRGFIQITGKDNYARIGKQIGVDLVNNPDLANDPAIAAKIIPAYFKMKLNKKTGETIASYDDIQRTNKAVGFQDPTGVKGQQRASLAQTQLASLSSETTSSSGTMLASASGESSALRTQMATAPQQAPVVINSTNQAAPQRVPQPSQTASAFNENAADLFLNNVLIPAA